jgi:hypothetical protein
MSKAGKTKSAATARHTASRTAAKKPVAAPRARKPASTKVSTTGKEAPAAKPKAGAKSTKGAVKGKNGKSTSAQIGKKEKTVRDSFNMPAADYALIGQMKARALTGSREVKKSELLRAGLRLLAALNDEAFKAALAAVPTVKTGRPGKKRKA